MTKLEQVKQTIEALSEKDQAKLRRWIAERNAAQFDEKIERDSKAGKLDKLAEEALADYRAGRTTEL